MDRTDVAYLVNSTPKYFYILPFHFTLLKRYAPECKWRVFFATEALSHPIVTLIKKEFPFVEIIPLPQEKEGFLESRSLATSLLPPEIKYVFPIQEDFLLEARPIDFLIKKALQFLDTDSELHSVRLMPCPGPTGQLYNKPNSEFYFLKESDMLFSYQATMWKRNTFQHYMDFLLQSVGNVNAERAKYIALSANIAEIKTGQDILKGFGGYHISIERLGKQANAVYLAPWPYRPTAVVRGSLQQWAIDLASREGVSLDNGPSLR